MLLQIKGRITLLNRIVEAFVCQMFKCSLCYSIANNKNNSYDSATSRKLKRRQSSSSIFRLPCFGRADPTPQEAQHNRFFWRQSSKAKSKISYELFIYFSRKYFLSQKFNFIFLRDFCHLFNTGTADKEYINAVMELLNVKPLHKKPFFNSFQYNSKLIF